MSQSSKRKKNKVPKITEAEYAAYLSALKAGDPPQGEPVNDVLPLAVVPPQSDE